jgi:hypothetical protein
VEDLTGKITGNTLTAAEWNQLPTEVQNVIEAFGQGLSNGDLDQLGKSIAGYAATGDWYTGGGAADVYTATKIAGFQAPPDYFVGMTVRFRPTAANTGASTINVATLGVKDIKREDGNALNADDIITARDAWIRYDGTDFLLTNFSSGDIITPSSLSPGLGIGQVIWTDNTTVTVAPGVGGNIEINIDGTKLSQTGDLVFILGDFGVGGSVLDTGSETSSTPYYMYVDNDGGAMAPVLSADAPTLPGTGNKAGYHPSRTDERCIGSFWNNAAEHISRFTVSNAGEMRLHQHDSDHEHELLTTLRNWTAVPLNIPKCCYSVKGMSYANGVTPTFHFGPDDAAGTLSDSNPLESGNQQSFMVLTTGDASNNNTASAIDIPIVNPDTPEIMYGVTANAGGGGPKNSLVITSWVDMFLIAPRS